MITVDQTILVDLIRASDDECPVDPDYTLITIERTKDSVPGTEGYGFWCKLIFSYKDALYLTWFSDPTEYWKINSGEDWDTYFPFVAAPWRYLEQYTCDREGKVKCKPVKRVEVVTYKYEVIP
jgi:hypothetical protein